jgi:hypothetical protein
MKVERKKERWKISPSSKKFLSFNQLDELKRGDRNEKSDRR